MKAKKGFNLRDVCGEKIIVAEGKENIDFSNIISMNESSAYLWQNAQKMEVEYDQALADSTTLMQQWLQAGIVEE